MIWKVLIVISLLLSIWSAIATYINGKAIDSALYAVGVNCKAIDKMLKVKESKNKLGSTND